MNTVNCDLVQKQFASFCCRLIKCAMADFYREKKSSEKHNIPTVPISTINNADNILGSYDENICSANFYITALRESIFIHNEALATALQELSSSYRDILLMSFIVGMTDREISAKVGISHQKVSDKRRKALHQVTRIMTAGGLYEK